MNAKTCKLLRKMARKVTTGQPPVAYIRVEHPDKFVALDIGTDKQRIVCIKRVTIQLRSTCTRAVYQQLKRAA